MINKLCINLNWQELAKHELLAHWGRPSNPTGRLFSRLFERKENKLYEWIPFFIESSLGTPWPEMAQNQITLTQPLSDLSDRGNHFWVSS